MFGVINMHPLQPEIDKANNVRDKMDSFAKHVAEKRKQGLDFDIASCTWVKKRESKV